MSYRITYEQSVKKVDLTAKHSAGQFKKWIYLTVVCVLSVAALSSNKVRSFLLPGDPQVTEKALIELVNDFREGTAASDAVTAFCREILDNA